MVRSLSTFPLLDGYRGARRGDVAALEDIIARLGALAAAHPEVIELDCNPVMVLERGRGRRRRARARRPAAAVPSLARARGRAAARQ